MTQPTLAQSIVRLENGYATSTPLSVTDTRVGRKNREVARNRASVESAPQIQSSIATPTSAPMIAMPASVTAAAPLRHLAG